jgi:hypothetical protein
LLALDQRFNVDSVGDVRGGVRGSLQGAGISQERPYKTN